MTEQDLELKRERLKHLYALEYEMVRATAAFEHAALRPLFMLNGGALITYLALYGPLRHGIHFWIGKYALFLWLAGLIGAILTALLGAGSQSALRKHRGREIDRAEIELGLQSGSESEAAKRSAAYARQGQYFRAAAMATGLASLLLFIAALWPAYQSIK